MLGPTQVRFNLFPVVVPLVALANEERPAQRKKAVLPLCGGSMVFFVSSLADGAVRLGPSDGREPHLLCCHTGRVDAVAVSPDGKWIASAGRGEIRLWPMPDFSKPPLHTLPYDGLPAGGTCRPGEVREAGGEPADDEAEGGQEPPARVGRPRRAVLA